MQTNTASKSRGSTSATELSKKDMIDAKWADRVSVPSLAVVIFTRQLASMLKSGVPVLSALDTLSNQYEHPNFGEVVRLVCVQIESGVNFSKAISRFPRVFPTIYVTMVRIGEQTGSLDDSLERLAGWLERDTALGQRLRSALSYPMFVFILSSVLTLALFYTLIPGFVTIFEDMKIELPLVTRVVIFITNSLRNPGLVLATGAFASFSFVGFKRYTSKPEGRSNFYRLCLKVPLLGSMLKYGGLSRYCGAMQALLATGMDISKALRLSAEASGSPLISDDAPEMVNSVVEGNPVSEYMKHRSDIYPLTLCNMVASGEEASRLSDMYGRSSVFYDMEMNYCVEALGAALEPLMLAGVSVVVGTIVVSIFLPMYSYIGKLSQ
jgi:type II secretory pathway component PulF